MTVLALTWFGLVLGVSFLATPVKFRAPSLTLPVALDVGHVTFHLLSRVEWVLSIALLIVAATSGIGPAWVFVVGVVAIVAFQTSWLLPRLDERVALIIAGETPPPARLHTIFAGLEGVKAVLLLLIGLAAP